MRPFPKTVASHSCRLCVIVGEAGVGKSRLAGEFQRGLAGRVLSGQCLPYREGITYWPLAESHQAGGRNPGPAFGRRGLRADLRPARRGGARIEGASC